MCASVNVQFKVKDVDVEKSHQQAAFWAKIEGEEERPIKPLGEENATKSKLPSAEPWGGAWSVATKQGGPVGGMKKVCEDGTEEVKEVGEMPRSCGVADSDF